jgi:hypothetical protein
MIGEICLRRPVINQIHTPIKTEKRKDFLVTLKNENTELTKDETNHNNPTKEILFIHKKVGRRKKYLYGINNTHHSKQSKDNIIRKLRIHGIRFGLDLINDCIKYELRRQSHKLRMINRKITSNITIEMNLNFINYTLEEIYQNSPNKTHNCEDDKNKRQIMKLRERRNEAPKTNELLDMKFCDLFNLFINGNKNELISKYGLFKARTFEDFINSISDNENADYINELKYNAQHFIEFFKNTKSRKKKDDEVKEKKKIFKSINNIQV